MNAIYEPKGRAREYSPLALNLYKGCTHGCKYCYAPAATFRNPGEFHASCSVRPGILEALAKDAKKYAGDKRHVLLSFTSDAYQPEATITTQAIEILNNNDVPFQVLTKGGTRSCCDFNIYRPGRSRFGTTLTFTNDKDRKQWEPNAATFEDRADAIRRAHALGIFTWVSLEPVIDPVQTLAMIPMLSDVVDFWKVGTLNYDKRAKEIDWAKFLSDAVSTLDSEGAKYYIKHDLAKYGNSGKSQSLDC